ncbi:hypothetical protein EV702DRAFT_1197965 [Suillus placidus]|uniref:Translocation protein sec72 n=1 Tax=Suillus placidus TaxID=48579 RepID=A0A9P6ZTQ3_9AGAM|nr:hypothetical protein EV702DRAFT_1197965 [Suillus placidus]
MSQQVQQAPAGQHSHAHPHPPKPAQQVMPAPQPDPVMQARIDADFKPVDIVVGGPSTAFAFCNTHKLEKCKQCNVDFIALNRVSKILVTNPTLRCPPPPTVVQQKLSQAVTNMKDEGNNLYKLNKTREALSKYNMAASIAVQRPAWENAAILREELSTVVSNRSAALLELGDYLGALVDAETVISVRRQWPKGHFRKAKALVALGHIEEAKDAISLGLQFEPNNTELSGYMLELDKQLASRNQLNTKEKPVSVTSS